MTLPQPPQVPEVDIDEGKRRVDAGALLLDVRNDDEWQAGHAAGAAWIPMDQIVARRDELPHDREIVVTCRSGPRSARVTEALCAWGYRAVNLAGGTQAWAAAGLPVVTDDGQPGTIV